MIYFSNVIDNTCDLLFSCDGPFIEVEKKKIIKPIIEDIAFRSFKFKGLIDRKQFQMIKNG